MKPSRIRLTVALFLLLGAPFLFACESQPQPEQPPTVSYVAFQNGAVDAAATEITMALAPGETSLLEQLPNLTSADLTGSLDTEEILAFSLAHPDVAVTCDVEILNQTLPYDTQSITVSGDWSADDILGAVAALPNLSELDVRSCTLENAELLKISRAYPQVALRSMVDLFGEPTDSRATCITVPGAGTDDADLAAKLSEAVALFPGLTEADLTLLEPNLSADAVFALQQEFPSVLFRYTFHLFETDIATTDESIDLYEVSVTNDGVPELEQVLACLPDCTYADMAYTGIDDETMAALAEKFPAVKFSWMIHFSSYYCRTDANMLKASWPVDAFDSEEADVLKYCTDLIYLDIGHNEFTDLSFLSGMKDLQVLIVAISRTITDISPLANCTQLEYLELFTNKIVDVSPLSGLTELKHLNLCNNLIEDASPLYGLQNLERLWISGNPLSKEQKELLVENLPNCEINFTTVNPTAEGWKKGARYDLLSEQFLYGSYTTYLRFGSYDRP